MPHHLSPSSPTFPPPPAARHYNSDLSIWLSVDPMSDKYPGVSPYTYCANNPVRLVDPDGDTIKFASNCSPEFREQYKQAIAYLTEKNVGNWAKELQESVYTYYISDKEPGYQTLYDPVNKTIYWSPSEGLLCDNPDVVLSPATILNHELGHAYLEMIAAMNFKFSDYVKTIRPNDSPYGCQDEETVIRDIETPTARALGEIGQGQELTRKSHSGTIVNVENVTSNKIVRIEE